MRILFVMYRPSHARYFESTLVELAARGHTVHVAVDALVDRRRRRARRRESARPPDRGDKLLDALCERHPAITRGVAPVRQDRWAPRAYALRKGVDYLRVLTPAYADAPKLSARMARGAPALLRTLTAARLMRRPLVLRGLDRGLRAFDRALPGGREAREFVCGQAPDLMLITSLVSRPRQLDYVRAARARGVPSALCVASWDNLTNKGLIQEVPDRVYVWNEYQRREAIEMHGVAGERIVITGAQCFDQWFDRRPSVSAAGFREALGFDPERPIVLYVCSYHFIAPAEPGFVARWVAALRAHGDARVRSASVLIRPYPATPVDWEREEVAGMDGVAVWPPRGALPTDEQSKSGYFDSLFHSSAVVGVNTSALVEAPIVGRRVFTILDDDFRDTQEGTLHFHYLMREHGGPLTVARDLAEHGDQLAGALGGGERDDQARDFVTRFLRPHGIEQPALGHLVDAIEAQGRG